MTKIMAHWMDTLTSTLRRDEGLRTHPYLCKAGKLTVGYGHNLDDVPLSILACERILKDDIDESIKNVREVFGQQLDYFPDNVKVAVCNLMFQVGPKTFSEFHDTILALKENRYADAADHASDSKWAKLDTPIRASRVTSLMKGINCY